MTPQFTGDNREPSMLLMLDYDGVIVDSKDLMARLFIKALKRNGFYGISTVDEIIALCDGNAYNALIAMGLSDKQINEIYLDYAELMASSSERAPLFRGVREVLRDLQCISYLYIVTSTARSVVENTLVSNKIDSVDGVFGSDFERNKALKIKHLMARHSGLRAFYVGDTTSDLIESHRAGAVAIAAEWGWHSVGKLTEGGPAFFLKSPYMLPYLLRRLAFTAKKTMAEQVS
jgi:phosphoglycolate phosphatase-like HAD superfamily hydrolase